MLVKKSIITVFPLLNKKEKHQKKEKKKKKKFIKIK